MDEREPPAAARRLSALPFCAAITTDGSGSLRRLFSRGEIMELPLWSSPELRAALADGKRLSAFSPTITSRRCSSITCSPGRRRPKASTSH
jgi:hypothetical protein